jgi:N utilization substance protein A
VGLRGTRIQVISRELRGEKIDIIEWSQDPATFVARALSPAKVSTVAIGEAGSPEEAPTALVVVADNQLSLAIGKKGQNARLAAKLTGMRIDIKSESEMEAGDSGPHDPTGESRAALLCLPEVSPELADALTGAGMTSPEAIVSAGLERLREVPDIGSRCERIYAAAEEWVAAQRSGPAAGTPGDPPSGDGPADPA